MNKKTVFVGISGGVDSALSAFLLKKQGYNVVGVFLRTWHPEFLVCNEEEERLDAIRVATHLDIPFLTFDLEDVYKKEVADYMISEYKNGRTPNPDVMCNKYVKFGAFLEKAKELGADYVATGHYAQIADSLYLIGDRKKKIKSIGYNLKTGVDPLKDQSYFLWTLTQEQLQHILFPIGHLKKTEVRNLAKKYKLPVASKKDSQGICFLGAVDIKDFLKHYIKEKKGKVLNELGEEVGYHNGAVFFTLGERHGFTINKKSPTDGAYCVFKKDIKKNLLFVSQNKDLIENKESKKFDIEIKNTNWISGLPKVNKNYKVQIRYHSEYINCKFISISKDKAKIMFSKFISVAPGQSCVFYEGQVCLGGGVVV